MRTPVNRETELAKANDARKLLALLGYTLEYTWTHSYGDFLIEYWESNRMQVLELHAPSHNSQYPATTSLVPSDPNRGSFKLAKQLIEKGHLLSEYDTPCGTASSSLYEIEGRYDVVSCIVGHGSRAHTIRERFNSREDAIKYFNANYQL